MIGLKWLKWFEILAVVFSKFYSRPIQLSKLLNLGILVMWIFVSIIEAEIDCFGIGGH